MNTTRLLTTICWCVLAATCFGQQPARVNADSFRHYGINPHYKWIKCEPIEQKNFYLLAILERDPVLRTTVTEDKALRNVFSRYSSQASTLDVNCGDVPACYTKTMLCDSASVQQVAERLGYLFVNDAAFRKRLQVHLHESGAFVKWYGMDDSRMLMMAWKQETGAINQIITNYTTNKGFRYPDIDSNFYDVRSAKFKIQLRSLFEQYRSRPDSTFLFFHPSMKLALDLLKIAGRDEASRNEPASKVNSSALARIAHTDWSKYPFSVILIFGEGPNDKSNISAGGKLRCDAGAELYRQGKAPFIVVSGGYVHPFRTQWCEALEMKKYLVGNHHIPQEAIIAEPNARHTTTNIRNTGRLIFRNGMPAGKKVLGVSSNNHIDYMLSPIFTWRNNNDLGYLPYAGLKRNGEQTIEFYPLVETLFWDAEDPLDP